MAADTEATVVQALEDLQAMVDSVDLAVSEAVTEVEVADLCVVVEEVAAEPADLLPIKRTRSTILYRSFILAASHPQSTNSFTSTL